MVRFQELNADGLTVVLVAHEPETSRFCARMVLLRVGRVESDGPMAGRRSARELRETFGQEHRAGKIGSNPMEAP